MTRPEMLEVSGVPGLGPLPSPGVETSSISGPPPLLLRSKSRAQSLVNPRAVCDFQVSGHSRDLKNRYTALGFACPNMDFSPCLGPIPSSADFPQKVGTSIPAFAKQKQVQSPEMLEVLGPSKLRPLRSFGGKTSSISGSHKPRCRSSAVFQTGFATQNRSNPSPVAHQQMRDFHTGFCETKSGPNRRCSNFFDANAFPATPGMSCQKSSNIGGNQSRSAERDFQTDFAKRNRSRPSIFPGPKISRFWAPKI